jgi:hypothetical protein
MAVVIAMTDEMRAMRGGIHRVFGDLYNQGTVGGSSNTVGIKQPGAAAECWRAGQ